MVSCIAPTSVSPPDGLTTLRDHCTAQVAADCTTLQSGAERLRPRGLELIKSCAKFYANGIDVPGPANRSLPAGPDLNQTLKTQFSSRGARTSAKGIIAACLLSLVLPSLALAGMIWWGTTTRPATALQAELRVNTEPSQAKRPLPVITARRSIKAAEDSTTAANKKPDLAEDIIVHKVRTEPIQGVWERPHHERDGAIQLSTELESLQ